MKKILNWLVPAVCLLIGVVLFLYFLKEKNTHLVKVAEPQLSPYGGYARPVIGYLFTGIKKDALGMEIGYNNTGLGDIADVKRSVITILKRNNKFTVGLTDTVSPSTPRPIHPDVSRRDIFYLPDFLPADTQIIYLKFSYSNKAGTQMEPLREMFTYDSQLLNQHLPETSSSDYITVKKLLQSSQLW